ncbi:MAG: hypothetical protein HDT40_09630 [Lachnospiraceae bacterium]|nr:hypothetical protein [Lachnospiraceae bacterium]
MVSSFFEEIWIILNLAKNVEKSRGWDYNIKKVVAFLNINKEKGRLLYDEFFIGI